MEYIGLDVHKQYSVACLLDEGTGEVQHFRLNNRRAEFEKLFSKFPLTRVVMEAGRSSYMVYDMIDDLVSEIQMANPMQVKAIAWAVVKTDKVDAQTLCTLLRAGVVPQVHLRSRQNRQSLHLLRQRMFFVKLRTMVKNRIHALVDGQVEAVRISRPQASDLFGKAGRSWMRDLELPPADHRMLHELLELLDFLDDKIRSSDRLVYRMVRDDPVARRLSTIPGIGNFYAALIRVEIDDISRFPDERRLHAYAGLVPTTSSSGGRTYHGRLSKRRNKWLQWALIEAVYPAMKTDLSLKLRYLELAARKPINVAKVAVARKLMTIVYKVWKQDREYTPSRQVVGSTLNRVALSHS